MEISLLKENSIKLKTKKSSIVVDPISKTQGDIVVLLTQNSDVDVDKVDEKKLVIDGAGEYEIAGTSIYGKEVKDDGVIYIISADYFRIVLLKASQVNKIKEEEEGYDAIIIFLDDKVDDNILSLAKECILYGDIEKIDMPAESIAKMQKVNLRKTEEFEGKVVLLS